MTLFDRGVQLPGIDPRWRALRTQLDVTRGQDWSLLLVMNDYCQEVGCDEMAAALRYCERHRYAPRCSDRLLSVVWFQAAAADPPDRRKPWELDARFAPFLRPQPRISLPSCRCRSLFDAYVKIAVARRDVAVTVAVDRQAAEKIVLA